MILKHEQLLLATLGDDGMAMSTAQLAEATDLSFGVVQRTLLKCWKDGSVAYFYDKPAGSRSPRRYWRKK